MMQVATNVVVVVDSMGDDDDDSTSTSSTSIIMHVAAQCAVYAEQRSGMGGVL